MRNLKKEFQSLKKLEKMSRQSDYHAPLTEGTMIKIGKYVSRPTFNTLVQTNKLITIN